MVDKILLKVKKISDKRIGSGENLKDILSYKEISLWWFIESSLYLRLKDVKSIKITDKKILIDIICHFIKIFLIMKFLFRGFFGRLICKHFTHSSLKQRKIIVSSPLEKWGKIIDTTTIKIKKGDTMLETIIDDLKKNNFIILGLCRDDRHTADIVKFFDKIIYGRDIWRPIEIYLTFGMIKDAFGASRKLENKWKLFFQYLEGENKKLFDIPKDFKIFFVYHIFQAIMYMELTKRAIEFEKPRLMFIASEYSDSGKAMVFLGKLAKIPTLAIQHGFFHHLAIRYIHKSEELSNKISSQHIQLPDKTAVFGPWFKKLLIQVCNYPPKNVVVTGQPRYDILTKSNEVFSKEEFCKNYKISLDKKIALIITQPFLKIKDREIFLRSVLKSLKKIDDIKIVIKPHPVENENWHKKIVQEEKMAAVVLPAGSSTYEVLYSCDIMIMVSSTTAIEASILDKPVIVANLIGDSMADSYMKNKAMVGVRRKEDLTKVIKRVLYNKKTAKRLRKKRKKFVYQYAYKQDGKATKRVIDLIKEMIESEPRV